MCGRQADTHDAAASAGLGCVSKDKYNRRSTAGSLHGG